MSLTRLRRILRESGNALFNTCSPVRRQIRQPEPTLIPPLLACSLFRHLSSSELRSRTHQALLQASAFGVQLSGGHVDVVEEALAGQQKRGDRARPRGLVEMLLPYAHKLPDMTLAVNGLAEVS